MAGFVKAALTKSTGDHPDVSGWYAWFLQHVVITNAATWAWAITAGEILVGLGLMTGTLTGLAAFFGCLLNMNYLMSGSVSTNPDLFVLAVFVALAWRVAGIYGLDRWVLPALGVPGHPGTLFVHGIHPFHNAKVGDPAFA